jgi:hypothetical protein
MLLTAEGSVEKGRWKRLNFLGFTHSRTATHIPSRSERSANCQ